MPRLHQAADLMRTWDGVITTGSVAAEIVDATKAALWPLVLEPKLGADWKLYEWQSRLRAGRDGGEGPAGVAAGEIQELG